jgi:hypothetical protein
MYENFKIPNFFLSLTPLVYATFVILYENL